MGRSIIYGLLFCGVGLIVLGVALGWPTHVAVAQDDARAEADFIGAGDCADCHQGLARDHEETPHSLALQDVGRNQDGILADFEQGADLRQVTFPGEDAPRAFTADDIAFAIGSGRYMQRYVYEGEDDLYAVFPAEWDTVAGVWRPYGSAENWPAAPEHDFVTNCAGCHTTGLNLERVRWEDEGVQCEACHGPGGEHAEAADDAGRRPDEDEIVEIHEAIVVSPDAQVCGQCHSQGVQADSAHPYPTVYLPGGSLADSGFALLPDDDPAAWYASGHGRLNNMQFNEWLASAHAGSLETARGSANAADGCATCHSGDYAFIERIRAAYEAGDLTGTAPDLPTLDTAQTGITCVTCHSPHTAAEEPFHLADGSYTVCTTCHSNTDLIQPLHHPVKEMFEGQEMVEGVAGIPSVHFSEEEGPRCVTCHMQRIEIGGATLANHTWRVVIPGDEADSPPDACSTCHTDLNSGDLQSLIEDTQAAVRARVNIVRARLGSITPPAEGSPESVEYNRVVLALNFVQNDGSMGVHNYAYADALLDETSRILARLSVPGANLEPTEGPAPTATPSADEPITVGMEHPVRTGARPMTLILLGVSLVILLGGTMLILRQSARRNQEAAR